MVSLDCALLNFSNNDLLSPIFEGSGSNLSTYPMVFSAEMSEILYWHRFLNQTNKYTCPFMVVMIFLSLFIKIFLLR